MQNSRSLDLSRLFGAALKTMETNQQAVNHLDGYNGNHGDNMVQNLRTITAALSAHGDAEPSEALRYASRELEAKGKGSTSAYYVKGLSQAAERLEGHSELSRGDVMTLVQSLLGAVPSQGYSQQPDVNGSVFGQIMGLAANQQAQGAQSGDTSAPESPLQAFLSAQQSPGEEGSLEDALGTLFGTPSPGMESSPDSPLEELLGSGAAAQDGQEGMEGLLSALLGGQPSQGSEEASGSPLDAVLGSEQPQGGGHALGGLLGTLLGGQQPQSGQQGQDRLANLVQALLPAAMAFLQAKQSGAEMPDAAAQALMALLANRQMDPLQAGTPRAAAGGLVAQSMLRALDG